MILAAWGCHGSYMHRAQSVCCLLEKAGVQLHCLVLNADGAPKHPLYVAADTVPKVYAPPTFSACRPHSFRPWGNGYLRCGVCGQKQRVRPEGTRRAITAGIQAKRKGGA